MFLDQKTLRKKVMCKKQRSAPALLSDCSERAVGVGRGAYMDPFLFFKKKQVAAYMHVCHKWGGGGWGKKRKEVKCVHVAFRGGQKKGENRRGIFFLMFTGRFMVQYFQCTACSVDRAL